MSWCMEYVSSDCLYILRGTTDARGKGQGGGRVFNIHTETPWRLGVVDYQFIMRSVDSESPIMFDRTRDSNCARVEAKEVSE